MMPVTPHQFSLFRMVLGGYLLCHFIALIPWSAELFSNQGLIADGRMNPTVFPNILYVLDSPFFIQGFLIALATLALSLLLGYKRNWSSLFLWYGWACLYNRDVFTGNPGLPYIGWMLLALALIPKGEPWARDQGDSRWEFPKIVFYGAWALMAVGYTASGIHKLGAPSWLNGTAIQHVLENPLARDTFLRDWLLSAPWLLSLMTWGSLFLEVAFAPLSAFRLTRPWAWLAMVGMHFGILLTIDFADLTWGILMVHLFTFDRRWLAPNLKIKATGPILFFDGVCSLCNGFIDFVFREDVSHVYRVAALQGETAKKHLSPARITDLNTFVLLENGNEKIKSDAVLGVLDNIGGIWRVLSWARVFPLPLRNWVYDRVAKNRYSVFGKKDTCRLPTKEERELFLN